MIEEIISREANKKIASVPELFDFNKEEDRKRAETLVEEHAIGQVIDDYREQQHELFGVNNPALVYAPGFQEKSDAHYADLQKEIPIWRHGKWVYYPWLSTMVHILEEGEFQAVRTARNKNLINAEEQEKFYNAVIGIGGLSIGSSVAMAITLQGGGKHFRLADFDRLALSNTNRIRAGVESLGLSKVEMTARQIYTVNPYATVELFPEGLTKDNAAAFFDGPAKLDIIIDELDTMAIKLLIREEAKKRGVAVVMAADNGDNAVVDIERYDEEPNLEFFHGRLGNVTYDELANLDKFGIGRTITKHIGPENVTPRMQESLLEMGKTIVSWPQLGGAALINGAAVAYCVRKILNKEPLERNRALISFDEKLIPNYNAPEEIKIRNDAADVFRKMFGL